MRDWEQWWEGSTVGACVRGTDFGHRVSPSSFPPIPWIIGVRVLAEKQTCPGKTGINFDAIVLLGDRGKPASEL